MNKQTDRKPALLVPSMLPRSAARESVQDPPWQNPFHIGVDPGKSGGSFVIFDEVDTLPKLGALPRRHASLADLAAVYGVRRSASAAHLQKPQIQAPGWTFLAPPKSVDLARVLREADEAGLDAFELSSANCRGASNMLLVRADTSLDYALFGIPRRRVAELKLTQLGHLCQRDARPWERFTWYAVEAPYIGRARQLIKDLREGEQVRVTVVPL